MQLAAMLLFGALAWLFREHAGWFAAAGLGFCYLMSLSREVKNEKRIASLEKQLGYVTTSQRSVSEIIKANRATAD